MQARTRLFALLVLAGCSETRLCPSEISLSDENNYRFDGSLDIGSAPLAAPGDPLFDWTGLTKDILGHDLDPMVDVVQVAVIVFENLTEDDVEEKLATDTLLMSDVSLYVSAFPAGATSVSLSELYYMGNDIDVEQYFNEGTGTWLLNLSDNPDPGVGARMLSFLEPLAASKETTLRVTNDSAALSIDVDLDRISPVEIAAGTTDLMLDWSDLGTNGRGTAWVDDTVDELMIARFDHADASDLQMRFQDVEILAESLWSLEFVGGSSLDVSQFSGQLSEQGEAFSGIGTEGTWALALRCTTCANPAPPFFTFLDPCP
jgi:hypothetical protein